ncbi:hypothetical protein, conserved [Eimeria praecox]|uniref:DNA-directed RNA polymerase III subunit RPC9 n=1 Tax=Eimeria praecox TaxID=51316 RepID=U6GXC1_9EIME|nr:hypothetical protein, conserved [Eimeria praecox]
MVQDYIRKTCPYLHLVRAPTDSRYLADRSKSHTGSRIPPKRAGGAQGGNRRATGISAIRSGGVSPLISRRCRECLDFLFHRFGLTELELLTIMNLGAFKPVEIYMYLDDCSTRFTEDDAAEMLGLIDLALMQQQPLPPLPECATNRAAPTDVADRATPMEVDSQAESKKAAYSSSEPEEVHQTQSEAQSGVRGMQLQEQQTQKDANHSIGLRKDAEPDEAKGNASEGHQDQQSPVNNCQQRSELVDLFAPAEQAVHSPAEQAVMPAGQDAGCGDNTSKEAKPRGRAVRGAAKRRPVSRRRRIIDD